MTTVWNREDLEEREARALSPLGVKARASRGRRIAEEPDPLRTCFQRDRDRILHSSAFRRLQQKTQVFRATTGDHYRTRLTHTLEVSQLARSACLSLGLNADVGETAALAHDLGHPPFGHAGEHVLHELMADDGGFRHNAQGLRIVDELEQSYAGRPGLNLAYETRICLLKSRVPDGFPLAEDLPRSTTPYFEGQLVDLCDRTAYVCHDMDDAVRSGLVPWQDFMQLDLPRRARDEVEERWGKLDDARLLRRQTVSRMISILVADLVHATAAAVESAHGLRSPEDIRQQRGYLATHTAAQREELAALLKLLRERFYRHPRVLASMAAGADDVARLFERLVADPAALPPRYRQRIAANGIARTVCDYVSGMTDRYVGELAG